MRKSRRTIVLEDSLFVEDSLFIDLISRFDSGERGEHFLEQPTLETGSTQKIVVGIPLTCNHTGDFGHETFDSSDGHTLCLILDVSDNVFNLQRKSGKEDRKRNRHRQRKEDIVKTSWIRLKL